MSAPVQDSQSLASRMTAIGREVSRGLWEERMQRRDRMMAALDRALELLDRSIEWAQLDRVQAEHPGGLKELTRLRESVCNYFLCANEYQTSPETMRNYFLWFAARDANQRRKLLKGSKA